MRQTNSEQPNSEQPNSEQPKYLKFKTVMAKAFPMSKKPPKEMVEDFKRYEKRENHYSTQDNRKERERKMLVELTNDVYKFGNEDKSDVCVWTLDHIDMGFSRENLDYFGEDIDLVSVPNPCSEEMLKSQYCPINDKEFKNVNLYGAFSYEWTREVANSVSCGKLLLSDLPQYGMVWYDACGVCKQPDLESIDTLIRLMGRKNGPWVLATTFSQRGRDIPTSGKQMTGTKTLLVDSAITEIARRNGYVIVRPHNAAIPFQKNSVFTSIYCMMPVSWKHRTEDSEKILGIMNETIRKYQPKKEYTLLDNFVPYIPKGLLDTIKGQEQKKQQDDEPLDKIIDQKQQDDDEFSPPDTDYQIIREGHVGEKYHKGGNKCAAVKATETRWNDKIDHCDVQDDSVCACKFCFPGQKQIAEKRISKKVKRKRDEDDEDDEKQEFVISKKNKKVIVHHHRTLHRRGNWSNIPLVLAFAQSGERFLVIKCFEDEFVWSKNSDEGLNKFINRMNDHVTLQTLGDLKKSQRCVRDFMSKQHENWLKDQDSEQQFRSPVKKSKTKMYVKFHFSLIQNTRGQRYIKVRHNSRKSVWWKHSKQSLLAFFNAMTAYKILEDGQCLKKRYQNQIRDYITEEQEEWLRN